MCWVAEAWGTDAPSVLGYLAARTDRMLLGSGVVQVGNRSPVVVAQTAITLSNLSLATLGRAIELVREV